MDELNVNQSTPSMEQANDYDALITESLNEIAKEGKEQTVKSTPKEAKKVSPEDILKSMTQGTDVEKEINEASDELETEADEVDKEVNESDASDENSSDEELLDIIYKGQVEPLPKSEVIKLAQMGKDYTIKTQALAAERQKFQAESLQKTQELETMKQQLEANQQGFGQDKEHFDKLKFAFEIIQDSNPDLYSEVDRAIAQVLNQYDNPVVRRQTEMLTQKQKMLEERLSMLDGESIKQKYYADESNVKKEFGPLLEKAGVIVDWQKVKEAYANGAKDVKTALFAEYGAEIIATNESKSKLAQVRTQASRMASKPMLKQTSKGVQQQRKITDISYDDILSSSLKELGL